jgi:hypothetical protein
MGIVVDEIKAKSTSCECYKLDGELLCWSEGIIGALSDKQEEQFCTTKNIKPAPKELKRRINDFTEAIHNAQKRYAKEDKDIKKWLQIVSEEMKKKGIKI